ncbi:similar to mitochondrial uncoupling protein [Cyanidioschyzon merolae strain 10D]|uniref:Similar to mitochondrial uncoupling protein n=1 Tax=Cyanidioschyzon merolae (strain NIES-3377 / 10D) TaxID=280699 RepID=M1VBS6_CYAM1|nr:similar to mitochondrial uncoupling protein [Cyanidioschyzon merolae strain 10D]BAM79837.1 similar to mitochondrial uncoupling protein [Cyanidioschyzon merolae strain 10D]|eukprot:XP_005536123.1 similar to mitochondrial uncoupling protein [Cyanidioschyzon merolae strain 10D]
MQSTVPSTKAPEASNGTVARQSTEAVHQQRSKPGLFAQLAVGSLAAGTATCVSAPFDLIKARLQLQRLDSSEHSDASTVEAHRATKRYRGMLHAGYRIIREEGPLALWSGLEAAFWRALTYSGVRLGLYQPIRDWYAGVFERRLRYTSADAGSVPEASSVPSAPVLVKLAAGATSGALGALVGTPFEAAKVRMQSGRYPCRNTWQVLQEMAAEGRAHAGSSRFGVIWGLWNGASATAVRAATITATQVGLYDVVKTKIADISGWPATDTRVFLSSAMMAGFFSTTSSSAFDVIKTTQQGSRRGAYRGMLDCAVQIWRKEGAFAFLKGWVPAYVRLGPHTMITLWVYEFARRVLGYTAL